METNMATVKFRVGVERRHYCIVFFPVAKYERCGDVAVLTVLGMPVWGRVGSEKRHALSWLTG